MSAQYDNPTICALCGFRFGLHRGIGDNCPTYDFDSPDFSGWRYHDKQFFTLKPKRKSCV